MLMILIAFSYSDFFLHWGYRALSRSVMTDRCNTLFVNVLARIGGGRVEL